MNGAAMVSEFRLGFDVIASNAAPGFTDIEIYSLLNRGQDYVINELLINRDFKNLFPIFVDYGTPVNGGGSNFYITLPSQYWAYVSSFSTLTRSPINNSGFISSHEITVGESIENELIPPEQAIHFFPSSFNSLRIFKNPKIYIHNYAGNNVLEAITDDYTTISYIAIRYIRKRVDISNSVSCELPEVLHRIVVDKAIDIAKTIINIQESQDTTKHN